MNFEHRRAALDLKRILSGIKSVASHVAVANLSEESWPKIGEISHQLSMIFSENFPKGDSPSIGLILDALNSDAIMTIFQGSCMVVFLCLDARTEIVERNIGSILIDAIFAPSLNPLSSRRFFATNLNEPHLKEYCQFVGALISTTCTSLQNSSFLKMRSIKELHSLFNTINDMLTILKQAVLNFNNRRAFSVVCDNFLTSALELYALENLIFQSSINDKSIENFYSRLCLSLNDIIQVSLFSENSINELLSISFEPPSHGSEPDGGPKPFKKRKAADGNAKAMKISSFAGHLYEVVAIFFQQYIMDIVRLKSCAKAIASLWKCFAASKVSDGKLIIEKRANENSHFIAENNRDDQVCGIRKHIAHNLHFALGLIYHTSTQFKTENNDPTYLMSISNLAAEIFQSMLQMMKNESLPTSSAMDKYVLGLKNLWQTCRESMVKVSNQTRSESMKYSILSSLLHVSRLIQLIDHRIVFDFSKQAIQFAFSEYGISDDDFDQRYREKIGKSCTSLLNSCDLFSQSLNSQVWMVKFHHLSAEDQDAIWSHLDYFRSKLTFICDLWQLFSKLRSLDSLLRTTLQLTLENEGNCWIATCVHTTLLENVSLQRIMYESFYRLPAGQWTKVWNIVLQERLVLMTVDLEKKRDNQEERQNLFPIGMLQATVLAAIFEANPLITNGAAHIPISHQRGIMDREGLDDHTKGIVCLFYHLVQSLNLVHDKLATGGDIAYGKLLRAQLNLLNFAVLYTLTTYANQYHLLDVGVVMFDISLPKSCEDFGDGGLSVSHEQCQYSCLEILTTHAIAVVIAIESSLVSQTNVCDSTMLLWEAIQQCKFSFAQLLINISGKMPQLNRKKDLRALATLTSKTLSNITQHDPAFSIHLFKVILHNLHVFEALSKYGVDGFIHIAQHFFRMVVPSVLRIAGLLNHQDGGSSFVAVENILDTLNATVLIDIKFVWTGISQGVVDAIDQENNRKNILVPLHRIVTKNDIQDVSVCCKIIFFCFQILNGFFEEVSQGTAIEGLDRLRKVFLICKTCFQSLLKQCRPGSLQSDSFCLDKNTVEVSVQICSILHGIKVHFQSEFKSIRDDGMRVIALYHHLFLIRGLHNRQNDSKAINSYLQTLASFDLMASEQFHHEILQMMSILLKDLTRTLDSDLTSSTQLQVENFIIGHVDKLLSLGHAVKLPHVALWLTCIRHVKNIYDKIPEKSWKIMLCTFIKMSAHIQSSDGVEIFSNWSLVFKVLAEPLVKYVCCPRDLQGCVRFDVHATAQLFHMVNNILYNYSMNSMQSQDAVHHDDPVFVHVGEGCCHFIMHALSSFPVSNSSPLMVEQNCKQLFNCLQSCFFANNTLDLNPSIRGKFIECVLSVLSVLLTHMIKAKNSTIDDKSDHYFIMFGDILSIFNDAMTEAIQWSRNPDVDNNVTLSLMKLVSKCATVINGGLFQLLSSSRAMIPLNDMRDDESVEGVPENTFSRIEVSPMIKAWTKKALSIVSMICEQLHQFYLEYKSLVFDTASSNVFIQICQDVLVLLNSTVVFATRGHLTNFSSKLPLCISTATAMIFILAGLESNHKKDESIQIFARQGFQMLARVFTNIANLHDAEKQLSFLITVIVKALADISTGGVSSRTGSIESEMQEDGKELNKTVSLSKSCKDSLYPGLFALFEKLNLKQKGQVFKLLDGTSRVVMTDIHEEFMRNYKFQGN
jgi:hypothetical protein